MTELTVPRDEAEAELKKRVDKGRELLDWSITSEHQLEEAESEFETWSEYNTHLLERIFSDSSEAYEYRLSVSPAVAGLSLDQQIQSFRSDVSRRIRKLESYIDRLHLFIVASNALPLHEPSTETTVAYDLDQVRLKLLKKVETLCRERPGASFKYEDIANTPQEGNEFLLLVDENYINAKPIGASKDNPLFAFATIRGLTDKGKRRLDEAAGTAPVGEANATENSEGDATHSSRQIFVVHGHDEQRKLAVVRFLEQLKFKAVVLDEQVSGGKTLPEKFEHYSNVHYAVILLTPDDLGTSRVQVESAKTSGNESFDKLQGVEDALNPRARQNVVFELGFFYGKLGRSNTCVLLAGGVENPSDIHGVVYVNFDEGDGWKMKLAKEIRGSGLPVDMNDL